MEKWKSLSRLPRVLLVLQAAMLVLFTILYPVISSREGILYRDAFLVRSEEDGLTRYAGRLEGREAVFTVSPAGEVTYQLGEAAYGPYTVALDPSAVPQGHDLTDVLTGVEVREGDEILFRGGWYPYGFSRLVWEDGREENTLSVSVSAGGETYDLFEEEKAETDPNAPTVSFLLKLVLAPELTHRGQWDLYFLGLLCTAMGAASIWFADALFRHNLRFLIRDPERAEPSEWELFSRKASWCFFTGLALFAYLAGLLL